MKSKPNDTEIANMTQLRPSENLYEELEEDNTNNEYNYAYSDWNTRPSLPQRELTNNEAHSGSRDSEGWVDNTAYVTGSSDNSLCDNDGDEPVGVNREEQIRNENEPED